ncbi:MAG: hypothetical protein VX644_15315, partial [Planctomycetota bacterium]|nr:hypothetical protein [Planctomycetota bacterium]
LGRDLALGQDESGQRKPQGQVAFLVFHESYSRYVETNTSKAPVILTGPIGNQNDWVVCK